MRLNPAKCSFGVQTTKFLGFMLTKRGIKVNPNKHSHHQNENPIQYQRGSTTNKELSCLSPFPFLSMWHGIPFLFHFEEEGEVWMDKRVRISILQLEDLYGVPVQSKEPSGKLSPLFVSICYGPGDELYAHTSEEKSWTTCLFYK